MSLEILCQILCDIKNCEWKFLFQEDEFYCMV